MLHICCPGPISLGTLRFNHDERLRKLAFQQEKEFFGLVVPWFPAPCSQLSEHLFAHLFKQCKDSPCPEALTRKLWDRDEARLVRRVRGWRGPGICPLRSAPRQRLVVYQFIPFHLNPSLL